MHVEVTIDGDEHAPSTSRGSSGADPGLGQLRAGPDRSPAARSPTSSSSTRTCRSPAGTFRNLTVVTDERSVFDAREPAACQYYYPHLGLMIDLFVRALRRRLPDAVVAGQPADPMNILFTGERRRRECSCPARRRRSAGVPGPAATAPTADQLRRRRPQEPTRSRCMESRYPLRVHRYALRADSGGAGRCRGGLGDRARLRDAGRRPRLSTWFERSRRRAGASSAAGTAPRRRRGRRARQRAGAGAEGHAMPLPRGARSGYRTGGGGGYGDPATRDAGHRRGPRRRLRHPSTPTTGRTRAHRPGSAASDSAGPLMKELSMSRRRAFLALVGRRRSGADRLRPARQRKPLHRPELRRHRGPCDRRQASSPTSPRRRPSIRRSPSARTGSSSATSTTACSSTTGGAELRPALAESWKVCEDGLDVHVQAPGRVSRSTSGPSSTAPTSSPRSSASAGHQPGPGTC